MSKNTVIKSNNILKKKERGYGMYKKVVCIVFLVSLILGINGSKMFIVSASEKIVYSDSNGNEYVYEGQIKDKLADGHGVATYLKGQNYVGKYVAGKRHGQGTYTYADGSKYVGEWKDDKRDGQGICSWVNGSKYVGEWKDGAMDGQGTCTW